MSKLYNLVLNSKALKMTTDLNNPIACGMTLQQKSSVNLFVHKDETTGIEYIAKEHIQMRGISNTFNNKNDIPVVGIYLYSKISAIHPRYRNSIPQEIADQTDLFALAPKGYLWKEDNTGTSYFHWDEWYSLQPYNYKMGSEFNLIGS